MLPHQTRVTWRFLSTLTKFDLTLTPKGTKNPNFNMSIRTSWDLCHRKYYQIPFLTTIHGSKSELKRLKYRENRVKCISTLPEAITFDLEISKDTKINLI